MQSQGIWNWGEGLFLRIPWAAAATTEDVRLGSSVTTVFRTRLRTALSKFDQLRRLCGLHRSIKCEGQRIGIGKRFERNCGAGKRELGVECRLPEWTRWRMYETLHLGNANRCEVAFHPVRQEPPGG